MARRHALDAIRSWPEESREPANWILHVHLEPDDVTDTELVWDDIGPWKMVVATRAFTVHESPIPHTASIRSFAEFPVPDDMVDVITELHGDLRVHPETGTVSASGPNLPTNVLALNLMAAVVNGSMTSEQARSRYVDALLESQDGHPPTDMTECHFAVDGTTGEPRHIRPSDGHIGPSTHPDGSVTRRDDPA